MSKMMRTENECLGHQERKEIEHFIEIKLQQRHVQMVDLGGFVTILNGPNYKKLTLGEVQESYKKSKEWEKIKTSFYSIP